MGWEVTSPAEPMLPSFQPPPGRRSCAPLLLLPHGPSEGLQGEAAPAAAASSSSSSSFSSETSLETSSQASSGSSSEELGEPASLLSSSPQTARAWRIPLRWSSSRRRCCGLFGLWC